MSFGRYNKEVTNQQIFSMPEGNPADRAPQPSIIQDPVIEKVKKALVGMELTEENIRTAMNDVQMELAEEQSVSDDPQVKKELSRQESFLVNRGNDVFYNVLPRIGPR